MKSVMFVCLGNICRSPMAEAIFNKLVSDANLSHKLPFHGQQAPKNGKRPHPGAQKVMRQHHLNFDGFRSQPISQEDFETADFIITMDNQNIVNLNGWRPPTR